MDKVFHKNSFLSIKKYFKLTHYRLYYSLIALSILPKNCFFFQKKRKTAFIILEIYGDKAACSFIFFN